MWRYQAKRFVGIDVSFAVKDPSAEFKVLGSDPL